MRKKVKLITFWSLIYLSVGFLGALILAHQLFNLQNDIVRITFLILFGVIGAIIGFLLGEKK